MNRSDLILPGTPKSARPLQPCQSKSCNGADRLSDGGVNLNPTKWVCAACYAVIARRLK